MTYCVGILVRDGLVMIADTRTNAGLDNIATFRKLHLFETPGERVIGVATAGNLAVSQSVLTLISEGFARPGDRRRSRSLSNVPIMFRAAQLVGRAIREVHRSTASRPSRRSRAASTCRFSSAARSRAGGSACS